jgi:hypothetical protein
MKMGCARKYKKEAELFTDDGLLLKPGNFHLSTVLFPDS